MGTQLSDFSLNIKFSRVEIILQLERVALCRESFQFLPIVLSRKFLYLYVKYKLGATLLRVAWELYALIK